MTEIDAGINDANDDISSGIAAEMVANARPDRIGFDLGNAFV